MTGASSKLERLEADLEEVAASGKKAIVFSQWVQTLEVMRRRLARFGPLEYHGKIPPRKRDDTIEQFRDDPKRHVLLMSYGAGSVGLNLQFCSYVFLFDRWWNPAVEDQAINRAHRIGAQGPVTVTRMLTLGTIEERIQQVLDEKRQLFATVFSETDVARTTWASRSRRSSACSICPSPGHHEESRVTREAAGFRLQAPGVRRQAAGFRRQASGVRLHAAGVVTPRDACCHRTFVSPWMTCVTNVGDMPLEHVS